MTAGQARVERKHRGARRRTAVFVGRGYENRNGRNTPTAVVPCESDRHSVASARARRSPGKSIDRPRVMIDGSRVIAVVAALSAVACRPVAAGHQNGSSSSSSPPSFPEGFPANYSSATDAAIDVQYASCKIITDRIVATAEGKFSRFCHGICNISTKARVLTVARRSVEKPPADSLRKI